MTNLRRLALGVKEVDVAKLMEDRGTLALLVLVDRFAEEKATAGFAEESSAFKAASLLATDEGFGVLTALL